ncbi:hypothetical protein PINS_up010825 [Pythium insidiosum]|nr:hypothetical protein PINS_up010825 [Pythium insidiosum]
MIEPSEHSKITLLVSDDKCPFSIDTITQSLVVRDRTGFDFETTPVIRCPVVITDDHEAPRTSVTTLTVKVGDVNEAPVIQAGQYGTIREDAIRDTFVLAVQASDPDAPASWRQLRFQLLNTSIFSIDASTGVIRLRAPEYVDYEAQQQHTLTVQVTDGGFLTSAATVYIEVINVEEAPVWLPMPSRYAVDENGVVPRAVFVANASDPDRVSNEQLRFELEDATASFAINNTLGVVTLVRALDYETMPQIQLRALVFKANATSLNSSRPILIDVRDVNEAPQATQPQLALSVLENLGEGTPVGPPVSSIVWDPENDTMRFTLEASQDAAYFTMDGCNGQLRIKTALDYEQRVDVLQLRVGVTDEGRNRIVVPITVQVLNVNEAPYFTRDVMEFAVPESSTPGAAIGYILAMDPDTTPVKLQYRLVPSDDSIKFRVDANNGSLTLGAGAALDFEQRQSFSLDVQVSDGLLTANGRIIIHVTDVNEPPLCSPQVRFVPENSPIGTPLAPDLEAIDPDETDRGQEVNFTLVDDQTRGIFELRHGRVVVVAPTLDFEDRAEYRLVFSACDTAQACSLCPLTVRVADVNEAPLIVDQESSILENSNGTAFTIIASDPDHDDSLLYEIMAQSIPGVFVIDPFSGRVSVMAVSALNYEAVDGYRMWLKVRVTDSGSPRLASTATITVHIEDVNEAPVSAPEIRVAIPEDYPVNRLVHVWDARDEDEGQEIRYSTLQDNLSSQVVEFVSPTRPELVLVRPLNYEIDSQHVVNLVACDPFQLCTKTTLTLDVIDRNDPPVFAGRANGRLSLAVSNHAAKGANIGCLHSTDEDVGDVGLFTLEPYASVWQAWEADGLGIIAINATSGQLVISNATALQLARNNTTLIVGAVVTDRGGLRDSAVVQIQVVSTNAPPSCGNKTIVFEVNENADVGTAVGQRLLGFVSDPDSRTVFQFDLYHEFLAVDGRTGQLQIKNTSNFDYETPGLRNASISVLVTDDGAFHDGQGRLSAVCSVLIRSIDVNEPPTTANLHISIEEGTL